MNTHNKTLVIVEEPGSNKTTSIIVEEKDVLSKTKEFLEKLSKNHKQAEVNVYSPVGVVLKSEKDAENYAVAYEREKFVIVSHKGTRESARLYGNWQDAITHVQRILNGEGGNTRFLLEEYQHPSNS